MNWICRRRPEWAGQQKNESDFSHFRFEISFGDPKRPDRQTVLEKFRMVINV